MANRGFERPDVKTTIIFYKDNKGYRFSGLVRQTDSNGETMMRITNNVITAHVFDDIQITDPPVTGDGDIGLTHFSDNFDDRLVRD